MKLTAKDLSFGEAALGLLREVESGKRDFEPEEDAPESLEEFQEWVRLLRVLESRRFIVEINGLNMTHRDGKSVIDKVRLHGGLTEKGRALLSHGDASLDEHAARGSHSESTWRINTRSKSPRLASAAAIKSSASLLPSCVLRSR